MRPGLVFYSILEIADENFIRCDGRLLNKKRYCNLYEQIQDKYGKEGDPEDAFRVPNLKNRFIREYNDLTPPPEHIDIGTVMPATIKEHTHNYEIKPVGDHTHRYRTLYIGRWFHTGSDLRSDIRSIEDSVPNVTAPAGSHTHKIDLLEVGNPIHRPKSFVVFAYISA